MSALRPLTCYSNNLWFESGTTSGAPSPASKENTSFKSSSSSKTSHTSFSTTSNGSTTSKKRKTLPSIYQQEIARKSRERLQRETPQLSLGTTLIPQLLPLLLHLLPYHRQTASTTWSVGSQWRRRGPSLVLKPGTMHTTVPPA